jgi:hypothetical protein
VWEVGSDTSDVASVDLRGNPGGNFSLLGRIQGFEAAQAAGGRQFKFKTRKVVPRNGIVLVISLLADAQTTFVNGKLAGLTGLGRGEGKGHKMY